MGHGRQQSSAAESPVLTAGRLAALAALLMTVSPGGALAGGIASKTPFRATASQPTSQAAVPPVVWVNTRSVLLEYRLDGAGPAEADVFISRDAGRSWSRAVVEKAGACTLRCAVPEDGTYQFIIRMHGLGAGDGADPAPGDKPTALVAVDTTPPLLQLHNAAPDDGDEGPKLLLHVTLVEEHPSDQGVRVFYRQTDKPWMDGGAADRTDAGLTWIVPDGVGEVVDLRVVAADRAGNLAISELAAVAVPRVAPAVSPTSRPAGQGDPGVALAAHEEDSPAAAGRTGTERACPVPSPEVQRLRRLADGFLRDGNPVLAAARLEDAVRIAPRDADVLAELGDTLYRLGRYGDADARFGEAAAVVPDHLGALRGRALVAATQGRYPDARAQLQRLLELAPQSAADWVRYGNVEHRLGNTAEALAAWQKVLELPTASPEDRDRARRRLDVFRTAPKAGP